MKKQLKVATLAGAAVLSAAAMAQAAPFELNIYGASAQYLFWNANAQNYAQTKLGCTATAPVNNGGKHGFVAGTNCTSTLVPVNTATNKRDIDIRYSGIASAEGPLAVKRLAPLDTSLLTSSAGACNQANGERAMYASATTTVCKPVHIGTADVAGETLNQRSSGQKLGPMGGGLFEPVLPITGINTAGLTPSNTVVVPFGFFVNSAVKATKCSAGLVGNYCTANSQCNSTPTATDGVCNTTPATIDSISRSEVNQIFGNQAYDWSDFGAYFTAQPVVACLRHAGSGTHAAFDATVMKGAGWGVDIAQAENTDNSLGPITWFNQGSTDLIKCVNGNSTATTTGSLIGAIGYADADQSTGVANVSQNVKAIKYNGVWPTRTTIRNGSYDFYTAAWLYTNSVNGSTVNNLANDLINFAKLPANIPADKVNYWAAKAEMKFLRGGDKQYPIYVGATSPMLP